MQVGVLKVGTRASGGCTLLAAMVLLFLPVLLGVQSNVAPLGMLVHETSKVDVAAEPLGDAVVWERVVLEELQDVDEVACFIDWVVEELEDGEVLVALGSEGDEFEFVDWVVDDDVVVMGLDSDGVVVGNCCDWEAPGGFLALEGASSGTCWTAGTTRGGSSGPTGSAVGGIL